MKKHSLLLIFILFYFSQTFGQNDSSVYKNLETRKFYSVGLFSQTLDGITTYEVNNRKVSKTVYEKYQSTWKNMETCCPCILQYYDENDVLLREAVACTDCRIGAFKEFYPNGKIKISGRYKENPTGDWKDIWDRKYCSVKDGQWVYFNEKGDSLYSEFWKDGFFMKQVPEQAITDIWKIELTLNGESVDKKILSPEQVKQLVVTPKYKNNSTSNTNLKLVFEVSSVGHVPVEDTFTLESFKSINVLKMLKKAKIHSRNKAIFELRVYNNDDYEASFFLDVKH